MRATLILLMTVGFAPLAWGESYYVCERFTGNIYLLEDLNADGDALDDGEKALWAAAQPEVIGLAATPGCLYLTERISANRVLRLTDVNHDGDALDAGETVVWGDGLTSPYGIALGADGAAYVAELYLNQVWRLADGNADGDALDVGESALYADGIRGAIDVLPRPQDVMVSAYYDFQVHRLVDGNGDGDALDVGENLVHTPATITEANGLLAAPGGGYYVGSRAADTVYLVRDLNGDGDALDVGEVLPYADAVFGGLDGPWGMAPYETGGFLLAEFYGNHVSLVRDLNGDGDALDIGEVVLFADGIAGPTSIAVVVPGLPLPGDTNDDGCVDGADYTVWADHYLWTGQPPWSQGGWTVGNFNEDYTIDGADYTVWADHYGPCLPGGSVPEPLTVIALALGGLAAARRRAR